MYRIFFVALLFSSLLPWRLALADDPIPSLIAAQNEYREFLYGERRKDRTLSPEEETLARELCESISKRYNGAFDQAKSDYEKLLIASLWWNTKRLTHYSQESVGIPLWIDELLEGMGEAHTDGSRTPDCRRFVDAVDASLPSFIDADARTYCLSILGDTWAQINGKVPIPADVQEDIHSDIPMFAQETMPLILAKEAGNKDHLSMTMRYYLWHAISMPKPTIADQQLIDEQIDRWTDLAQREAERIFKYEKISLKIKTDLNDRMKGMSRNRFLPYYKYLHSETEYQHALDRISGMIEDIEAGWESDILLLTKTNGTMPADQAKYYYDMFFSDFLIAFNSRGTAGIFGYMPLGMSYSIAYGHMTQSHYWVSIITQ